MGLGITRASLVSAICDKTGDSSADAIVKVKRLINEKGPEFCNLADWPFLRDSLNFSITTAASTYSGASYLPTTFKKVLGAYLIDGTTRYPLTEVGIKEAYNTWENPDEVAGMPYEFAITQTESGYWQIAFNMIPDRTYTVYLEIELQWTDLTADSSETVMTKEYYPAFVHFVSMAQFFAQGDSESYAMLKNEWDNPANFRYSTLGTCLAKLSNPLRKRRVVMDSEYMNPGTYRETDYRD